MCETDGSAGSFAEKMCSCRCWSNHGMQAFRGWKARGVYVSWEDRGHEGQHLGRAVQDAEWRVFGSSLLSVCFMPG